MRGPTLRTSVFLICLVLSGCSSVNRNLSNILFPPNPHSDRRVGENVELMLKPKKLRGEVIKAFKQCKDEGRPVTAELALPAIAAPALIGAALTEISKFLEAEAARYSASYSAIAISDIFYDTCLPDEASINLDTVTLKRSVKGDPDGKPAMEFQMKAEPTVDSTAFALIPTKLVVRKAKAKLIAVDWLAPLNFDLFAPWTILKSDNWLDTENKWFGYDNDVDLKIEVSLYAIWVEAGDERKIHNELVAKQEFNYLNVELGDKGIPDLGAARGNDDPFTKSPQLLPAIPRSFLYKYNKKVEDSNGNPRFVEKEAWGGGNYIMTILVTEHDNFSERVKELGNKIKENKEGLVDKITKGLD